MSPLTIPQFQCDILLKIILDTFTEKTEALQSMGKSRIYFLGTGCAIPSKYRNVSGILLRITPTNVTGQLQSQFIRQFENAHFLFSLLYLQTILP